MLKNNPIFLFIIALFFFYSCNKEHKNIESNDICIDIEKKAEVSIFDIFSKVEIIRLEINDSSIIKSIDKLFIYKDL